MRLEILDRSKLSLKTSVPAVLKLEPPYRLSVVDKTLRPYKNPLASGRDLVSVAEAVE